MAETALKRTNKISLRLSSKEAFLSRYLPDVGIGGFLYTGRPPQSDETIDICISFIGYARKFDLQGRMVWKNSRPPSKPELPPGVGLEFDQESKHELTRLVKFVSQEDAADSLKSKDDREKARLHVKLNVEFLIEDNLVSRCIENVSSLGAFIRSDELLEEDSRFVFFLSDEKLIKPLVMEARVAWISNDPELMGFGIQFLFDSRKHKLAVQKYIDGLSDMMDEE